MRRIYLLLIGLAILLTLFIGYKWGSVKVYPTGDVKLLRKERSLLTKKLNGTYQTIDSLKKLIVNEKAHTASLDSKTKLLGNDKVSAAKKYGVKIKKLESVKGPALDTVLTKLYPFPRQSFNLSTRYIAVPEWRVFEITRNSLRFDSLREASQFQEQIITRKNISIYSRDRTIDLQDKEIIAKDTAISIIMQREVTYAKEALIWKDTAKKYKRQRNWVIAGVTTVVAGSITMFALAR